MTERTWSVVLLSGPTSAFEMIYKTEDGAKQAYSIVSQCFMRRTDLHQGAPVALTDDFGRMATFSLLAYTGVFFLDRELDRQSRVIVEAENKALKIRYPAPTDIDIGFMGPNAS